MQNQTADGPRHNNAGPKFGIQLFDQTSVRAAASLAPDSAVMEAQDLLHIPTPWHNCVIKLGDRLIITKSETARNAVTFGTLAGGLVQGKPGQHDGAYFELRDPASATMACLSTAACSPPQAEIKAQAVKAREPEATTRRANSPDGDNTNGRPVKDGPPVSWWLVWLRRVTASRLWSRSWSYAVAHNAYQQHKSQSLGT